MYVSGESSIKPGIPGESLILVSIFRRYNSDNFIIRLIANSSSLLNINLDHNNRLQGTSLLHAIRVPF